MLTVTRSINDTLLIREPCSIRIAAVDGIHITFEIMPATYPQFLKEAHQQLLAEQGLGPHSRSGFRELPLPVAKNLAILPDGTQVLVTDPLPTVPPTPIYPTDLDTAEKRHQRIVGNSIDGPGAGSPSGRGSGHGWYGAGG